MYLIKNKLVKVTRTYFTQRSPAELSLTVHLHELSDYFRITFSRCITLFLHGFYLPLQHMCTDVTAHISRRVKQLKQSITI